MSNRQYGYARVSTKEQRLDRQIDALVSSGLSLKDIFVEKQSGKDFSRKEYERLTRRLRPGDTLFILSIDRLGRNYQEIINQWRWITKEIGADIVVLDMPLLDTRQRGRDLIGTFVADIVLQILSYVAQVERENILSRQAAGIAAAKARGVHFGRSEKPLPPKFAVVVGLWRQKEISLQEALARLKVSRSYFYKHARSILDADASTLFICDKNALHAKNQPIS